MSPVQSLTSSAAADATAPVAARIGGLASRPSAGDTKQAAKQFEAIILRQLLEPVIQPAMSGLGGGGESSGGSIYGYMLTDAMANQLAQGGGLGLSKMLEKEFTPKGATTPEVTTSAALKLHPSTLNPRE